MKVVIFCGGLGMRLREYSESIPKPMVHVGYRPILWHVMRYYAHFGHKDFILCLGYKGDSIKKYFLEYDETVSNDFVFSEGGKKVDLLASDIHDWKITFVDTGLAANIGMRLKAVQPYLKGEEMFLANYSDGVADLPLPAMIDFMKNRPQAVDVKDCGMRINGGYFVLRPEIFDWMRQTAARGSLHSRPGALGGLEEPAFGRTSLTKLRISIFLFRTWRTAALNLSSIRLELAAPSPFRMRGSPTRK